MNNRTKITAEPGKQDLELTREYNATRELVFKAYTVPEAYIQWLIGIFSLAFPLSV